MPTVKPEAERAMRFPLKWRPSHHGWEQYGSISQFLREYLVRHDGAQRETNCRRHSSRFQDGLTD